jgi:putative membrane protein insertion efficiency factor
MVQKPFHYLWHLPRVLLVGIIRIYQHTLSPDHGPLRHLYTYGYCRHEPTCSEYAMQVLTGKGAILGTLLAGKRILSCNPFAKLSDAKLHSLAAQRLHRTP